jgi:hypothetical protein
MTKFFIAFVSVLVFWACGEAPTYTEEKVHLRLEKGDEVVEVTCNSGTGAGAVNGTQCEETWDNCSDGSVYEVFCV